MQPEKSLGYPAEGDFPACNALFGAMKVVRCFLLNCLG